MGSVERHSSVADAAPSTRAPAPDGLAATMVACDLNAAARLSAADALARLHTSEAGLSTVEAAARRLTFGANVLASHRVAAFGVLWRQIRNPLLILLLGAAGVSSASGDPTDGAIIAAIVILSVGSGSSTIPVRRRCRLHANIRHEAVVWRDGNEQRLDVAEVVPGDVVRLGLGDLVPADVRLIEVHELECDEAVLTGESLPSAKSVEPASTDSAVDLPSCAFMGTVVHQGSGRAVVVATGSATAFGKIAVGLGEHQAETAFQVGLRGFSRLLVRVAAVLTLRSDSTCVLTALLERCCSRSHREHHPPVREVSVACRRSRELARRGSS